MEIYFILLILFGTEVLIRYGVKTKKINVMLFDECIFSDSMVKMYEKIILVFDFILLFVLAVCRDVNVGSDYVTYMTIFSGMTGGTLADVSKSYFWADGEIGFALIGTLIGTILDDPIWIVCVFYLIVLGGVYRFIKKHSRNVLLSTFLFLTLSFYNMSYNVLRQYLAAVILLKAIDYINKDFKRFVLVVVLAATFHKTALIFLLVYPVLTYAKDIKVTSLMFLLIMGGAALFAEYIFVYLGEVLSYTSYINDNQSGGMMNAVVMATIFALFFVFAKKLEHNDAFGRVWIGLAVVAFSISMFSIQIHPFNRLLLYFIMPAIVSIANFVNIVLVPSSVKYGELFVIMLLGGYYSYLLLNTSVYQTIPYTSRFLGI